MLSIPKTLFFLKTCGLTLWEGNDVIDMNVIAQTWSKLRCHHIYVIIVVNLRYDYGFLIVSESCT